MISDAICAPGGSVIMGSARDRVAQVVSKPLLVKLRERGASGELKLGVVATPVGPLSLATSKEGLHAAFFDRLWAQQDEEEVARTKDDAADLVFEEARTQIQEYFAASRKEFTIPLLPDGTNFQKKAWDALQKIPYGQTVCYADQAALMGEPGKARAVGAANGRNPICLFIPCHRVIAKGGDLCGYAFGLDAKQQLLDLENRILA